MYQYVYMYVCMCMYIRTWIFRILGSYTIKSQSAVFVENLGQILSIFVVILEILKPIYQCDSVL